MPSTPWWRVDSSPTSPRSSSPSCPYVRASVIDQPGSLYVITEKQLLETESPFTRFGKMRLYHFQGANQRGTVNQLFEATGRALQDEPVAPPSLAVYYKGLITMSQLFKNSLLELEYTRLYHVTERYRKKHRQMPAQLRSPAMLNN